MNRAILVKRQTCVLNFISCGLRPFYDWVTEHVDSATLWRTKDRHLPITAPLLGGLEFFLRALPLLEPRVYYLGRVERDPVVVCSDAEWSPPPHPPLTFDKGLGGCIFVDGKRKGCALETPEHICNALAPRQTQIIPLELLALQRVSTDTTLPPLFAQQFLFDIIREDRSVHWFRKFIEQLLAKHS